MAPANRFYWASPSLKENFLKRELKSSQFNKDPKKEVDLLRQPLQIIHFFRTD